MSRLELRLLGPPQLELDGEAIHLERRKSLALLSYLVIEGGPHQRDFLSSLLWPDNNQSTAFKNLRQLLWDIQRAVGEGWLVADRDKVRLIDPSPSRQLWTDARAFLSLVTEAVLQESPAFRIPLLTDAVKLYRNHFLTGFSLKDASHFNDWMIATSEELRQKLATVLDRLSEDYCALGQPRQAIPYARRRVSLDPLDEPAHRLLMKIYFQSGQHSAALKQYQDCEQILRRELNVDPQAETRALYREIRKGNVKSAQAIKPAQITPPRHNLPAQVSSFIGRKKEIKEVAGLLSRHRLVMLVGTGGIGKTSLALQVGHTLLNEFPHGVWFIALDSLFDPALVPQTVASICDIREGPDRTIIQALANLLKGRTALLIFDNCEHVLEACSQLATTLLRSCPNLKILATSRELLNIPGEATYQMPALSMPEQNATSMENLTEYESIHLFTERASLALSSFALTSENAQAVLDICRKVGGIPLAIELAAACVNILQVSEISDQLQNSFSLLSMDSRRVLSHHQTLQASLDWSWRLLSPEEQKLFRQLAVFVGGWTLESAQAICDGDVLALTHALAKKSLVTVRQEKGHETRYDFHELVRQYAREKLVEAAELEHVQTRHLKYFLQFTEQAEYELIGPQQMEWQDRVMDERDNLRAGLSYAIHTRDVQAGLSLTSNLGIRFWEDFDVREGLRWLEQFLPMPEANSCPEAQAKALCLQSGLLWVLQRFDESRRSVETSLSMYRAQGNVRGEIDAILWLGSNMQYLEGMQAKTALHLEALRLARSIGDVWREAIALGVLAWDKRDIQQSYKYWEESIRLFRQLGDRRSLVEQLSTMAETLVMTGELDRAKILLDEANEINRLMNNRRELEFVLTSYGYMALMEGDYERAYEHFQENVRLMDEVGNRMGYLWARARMGFTLLRLGQTREAGKILIPTLRDFYKDGNREGVIFAVCKVASLCIALNKPEVAAQLIGWDDASLTGNRPIPDQAEVDRDITDICAQVGTATYEEWYRKGRAISLDEAVAYALGDNKHHSYAGQTQG